MGSDSDSIRIFRTSHHPDVPGHDHLNVLPIARATSAAPTYFNPAPVEDTINQYEAVDGGIWANCPTMVALCEAISILKWPLDQIDILSVGTTSAPSLVGRPSILTGKLGWASRAPDLFMKTQMQSTLKYTQRLLGDRFVRVDDTAQTTGLDDVGAIPMLINQGVERAERQYDEVQRRFYNGIPVVNWRNI